MVGAPKIGLTVLDMLENGKMTRQTAMGYCIILTVTNMKGNGSTIKPTGKESTLTPMELVTAEDGLMISSMDTAVRPGKMVQHMRANTTLERKTEKAN